MALSFDKTTLLYSRFLQFIAILPFGERGFASLTNRAIFIFQFVTSVLHWNMYMFHMINKTEVPTVDTICESVMTAGIWIRFYLLLPQRVEFAALLAECRAIWDTIDQEDRRVVRQFERKVRMLFLGFLGNCFTSLILYSLSAILVNLEAAKKANDTHGAQRILPMKWYDPKNVDTWPGYKFNFALQIILEVNAGIISTSVDTTAPLLIMFGAGYCRAVQRHLERVYERAVKCTDDSYDDIEITTCCSLHRRVLSYCTKINEMAQALFFVQLACTGYNTALIAVKLAGRDPDRFKYMPLALLNLSQLFICQWTPDHLIDESLAISTAAYNASFPWMRRRAGKMILLMIARAQKPAQMTAAGVVNLSLENFGHMLKGALSFFTMLRNCNT